MSDTTDDIEIWESQISGRSDETPLRERMRAFVDGMDPPVDVKAWREAVTDGTDLSEIVDIGRNERV